MFSFVWKHVDDIVRGNSFEDWRWFGRYVKEGWDRVGVLQNGFYPYIDFWKNGVGISFKSTNQTTWAGLYKIRKNIEDMSKNIGKEIGDSNNRRFLGSAQLEIAVPKGNEAAFSELWTRLRQHATDNNIDILLIEL